MVKPNSSASKPLILLCIFLLIVQIANGLYFARRIEPSPAFDLMYALGFLWLVGWWLKEDSKRYAVQWVYDMGFFLYLAWPFIIPYYLFRTRGIKAFITMLFVVGIFLGTYLVGVIVALLFAS
jgi:hypothetical protein